MTYAVVSADELGEAAKREAMAKYRLGLLNVVAVPAPGVALSVLKTIEKCDAPDRKAVADLRELLEASVNPDASTPAPEDVYAALNRLEELQ